MFHLTEADLYTEKRKYTEIANAIFVLIFLEWEKRGFETKFVKLKYSSIFPNNEIPLSCVKTKVSQLRKYKMKADRYNVSAQLIDLYEALKNVGSYQLNYKIEQSLHGSFIDFMHLTN